MPAGGRVEKGWRARKKQAVERKPGEHLPLLGWPVQSEAPLDLALSGVIITTINQNCYPNQCIIH